MLTTGNRVFGWNTRDQRHMHDEIQALLPSHRDDGITSAIPAKDVTIIALRLKHQLEVIIPCELPEERVTSAHSNVITDAVISTAKSAGEINGKDYSS